MSGDDSSAGVTCRRAEENKKRERKEGRKKVTQNSGKLAIRPDHPCRRIKIKLYTVGGLRCVVIRIKCDPNRLRAGFESDGNARERRSRSFLYNENVVLASIRKTIKMRINDSRN